MNSKLILSFIIIVCLFPLVTFSQSTDNLRFGAQVSPTISWISSDHAKVLGGGPDLGLKVGAIGEFGFAENYFFTVGLRFWVGASRKDTICRRWRCPAQ
jgi:hypothetical protein